MNTLIENIVHQEIKNLLTERLSTNLYHFTDFENLLNIIKTNKLFLTSVYESASDSEIYNDKLFYVCFTREKARVGGYGASFDKNVRIEFDGDMLNQRFSGRPVDFFKAINKKGKNGRMSTMSMKPIPSYQPKVESEDRLFSDDSVIPNIRKYIKRIDVLINTDFSCGKYQFFQLKNSPFSDIIYVYNNVQDFKFQTKNILDFKEMEQSFNSFKKNYKEENDNIIKVDKDSIFYLMSEILNAFYMYAYNYNIYIGNPNIFFIDKFKAFGLDEFTNYLKNYSFGDDIYDKYIDINNLMKDISELDTERKIYSKFCHVIRYLFKFFKLENNAIVS